MKRKPHFPKKKLPTRVPNHRLVHCQVYDVKVQVKAERTVRVRAESPEQAAKLAVNRTNERYGVLSAWNATLLEAKANADDVTQPVE